MKKPSRGSFKRELFVPFQRAVVGFLSKTMWAVSPALTIKIMQQLFFIPPKMHLTKHMSDALKSGEKFSLAVFGKRMDCWKWGDGPPVILFHGWGDRGARLHHFVNPLVECGNSVFTCDLLAHGGSEGRHTNFLEFREALGTMLKHTGKPKGVIAYSMGAGAVVSLADHFDGGTKLVLVAPFSHIFESLHGFMERFGIDRSLNDAVFLEYEKMYDVKLADVNPAENAPKLMAPTLVLHDEGDRVIPMRHTEELVKKIPNAKFVRTKGVGHFNILESEQVVEEALSFICSGRAETGMGVTSEKTPIDL